MPGGGPHKLAPGQITDDGELSLCLMQAIINGNGQLDPIEICKMYGEWVRTSPYDIGITTMNTIGKIELHDINPQKIYSYASASS